MVRAPAPLPSYVNGFAPRNGPAAYPSLWAGLLLAWTPALGNTGNVLRDCGPARLHGTGSGLTLSSAWDVRQGYPSLRTDGVDDYVVASPNWSLDGATFSCWFVLHTLNTWQRIVDGKNDTGFWFGRSSNTGTIGGSFGGQNAPHGAYAAYTLGTLAHYCITRTAAGLNTLYVNGIPQATTYTGLTGSRPVTTVAAGQNRTNSSGNERSDCSYYDIRLYGRVLNQREITQLASDPLAAYLPAKSRRFVSIPDSFYPWHRRRSGLLVGSL